MKVLNFGSLNVDYVYQVDHMVTPGETLASGRMDIFLGGKGFNQSAALARAGVPVYHAGLIGEDGEAFLEACREYGIQAPYIKKIEGKSGHTIIQVNREGQNSILLYGGSNQAVTKEFVDSVLENFGKDDFLILQNEISQLDYIIDKGYERGMQVVLNPSPFNKALEKCDMGKVSCFLLNEIEGWQLTGEKEPDRIIEKALEMYPDAKLVLTLGGEGSVYADRERKYRQAIYPVKAVDTTAAGDTFTGYFIAGLVEGRPIEEIMKMCSVASGIAVSRKGASPSIPRLDEVMEML